MKKKTRTTARTATGKNSFPPLLVGYGFDIHNVDKKRNGLVLGGVKFASEHRLVAHSDGDVVLHALSNAVLGALGLGDIGFYFSDRYAQNKDLDSKKILADALKRMRLAFYEIGNVDIQVVAQKLMIASKRDLLVVSLQRLLGCERVNIKGTR